MKIDNTTPIDQLVNGIGMWEPHDQYDARMAELERRSELAAKYERLTQALSAIHKRAMPRGDAEPAIAIGNDYLMLFALLHSEVWESDDTVPHDGTPDSIADAIIKAAEAER